MQSLNRHAYLVNAFASHITTFRTSARLVGLFIALFCLVNPVRLVAAEPNAIADRVASAINSGDLKQAKQILSQMNVDERIAFIPKLHELKATQSSRSLSESSRKQEISSSKAALVGEANVGTVRGGGAQADFQPLMDLIQSTVKKGNWEDDGGSDTINQFLNGVWIDPAGTISRVNPKGNLKLPATPEKTEPIQLPQLGVWQSPSKLRWISLTELQSAVQKRTEKGSAASLSMELLGGLTRIDFLKWDSEKKEWLLGGPAGSLVLDSSGNLISNDNQLPPVLLEDLVTLAPHILGMHGTLGCTIDPNPERLKAAQDFASNPTAARTLSRSPAPFTQELRDKLGKQDVKIFGLPQDSPTGLALLVADQHMKRLGFGLEPKTPGLVDYVVATNRANRPVAQGLVRWWFAIHPSEILANEDKTLFVIPNNSVQVLSEQQWVDAMGNRKATGKQDPAADAFAKSFTERFGDIQKRYPMYGRLRHIFDLCIALELIRQSPLSNARENLAGLLDRDLQPHLPVTPTHVETIATWTRLIDGQTIAIASGGVSIDLANSSTRVRIDSASVLSRIPSRPANDSSSQSNESWWR